MQIYMVGGAVRDTLLGLSVKDRDWVVVGATPDQMTALGFVPVGKDFPVFLHPATREEYALARTERKTAPGYRGFAISSSTSVTLEQDLSRRDLTLNAMAVAADRLRADLSFDSRDLIDPYQGRQDVENKVLRHVTLAFCEDPVRILRVARLAARLGDFTIASTTRQLMREMVQQGEVDHLVPERVWQEFSRGLMQDHPCRMLDVLADCGAWSRLWPGMDTSPAQRKALELCAEKQAPLPVRFACLLQGKPVALSKPLRVPTPCSELAELVARQHQRINTRPNSSAEELLQLLQDCDAWRQPERFEQLVLACQCLWRAGEVGPEADFPQGDLLLLALAATQALDSASISRAALAAGSSGPQIGKLIRAARLEALRTRLIELGRQA